MGTYLAARLNHGGMPRTEIARESGDGAIPPWLKVIVVVEELGEAHGAGSEDDRADSPALRAIGHGQGGTHAPRLSTTCDAIPAAMRRFGEHHASVGMRDDTPFELERSSPRRSPRIRPITRNGLIL